MQEAEELLAVTDDAVCSNCGWPLSEFSCGISHAVQKVQMQRELSEKNLKGG